VSDNNISVDGKNKDSPIDSGSRRGSTSGGAAEATDLAFQFSMRNSLNESSKSNLSLNDARIDMSGEEEKEDEQPTVVLVSFKINNITNIDVSSCTFNINFNLFNHWEDEKLIGKKEGPLRRDELGFDPDVIVVNDLTLETHKTEYNLVNSDTGAVKMVQHIKGKVFLLSLDLQVFPFDCQNLSINLRSRKTDHKKVVLEYLQEESTVDAHPQHEWVNHGYTAMQYTTLPQFSTTGKIYSSLHLVVLMQRHASWYIHNAAMPSFGLTILSWASYLLSDENRILLALGAMLLSLLNRMIISHKLPKVPYRTLIETYLDASLSCQFLSLLSAVAQDRWGDSDSSSASLDLILFLVNLCCYLAYHCWLFLKIKTHLKEVKPWREKATAANNVYDLDPTASGQFEGAFTQESEANTIMAMDINSQNIGLYKQLGLVGNKAKSRFEQFGDGQTIFEEDEEEEESFFVSLGLSGKLDSPRARNNKSNESKQEIYEQKLSSYQERLAERGELSKKLEKYGLSGDYAQSRLYSKCKKEASKSDKRTSHSTDSNSCKKSDSNISHRHSSTLDFNVGGYVRTEP